MILSCAREFCGTAAQSCSAPQYRVNCTGIRLVAEEKRKNMQIALVTLRAAEADHDESLGVKLLLAIREVIDVADVDRIPTRNCLNA
jgi:hypothetical protein